MENMNKKIKTICLVLIIVAILVGAGFYHYQKVERKYQACKNKCFMDAQLEDFRIYSFVYKSCIESCKEKYGK